MINIISSSIIIIIATIHHHVIIIVIVVVVITRTSSGAVAVRHVTGIGALMESPRARRTCHSCIQHTVLETSAKHTRPRATPYECMPAIAYCSELKICTPESCRSSPVRYAVCLVNY
jgi:hypothetical protein